MAPIVTNYPIFAAPNLQGAKTVLDLRQEQRFCQIHDQDAPHEPAIICSLGLAD